MLFSDITHPRRRAQAALALLALVLVTLGVAAGGWLLSRRSGSVWGGPAKQGRFEDRLFRAGGRTMPYTLYFPPAYTERRRWPVILYLHGWGERGRDGRLPLRAGLAPQLRRFPERFPCLVVMPQTESTRWSGTANDLAFQALQEVVRTCGGDRDRLYLTGVSMGGAGCWRLAAAHPRAFAAVVPVCGQGEPRQVSRALRSVPIWAFEGALDRVVPPARVRAMVEAVRNSGNRQVRFTLYPAAGHNAWDPAYGDPAVITWVLAQRRPQRLAILRRKCDFDHQSKVGEQFVEPGALWAITAITTLRLQQRNVWHFLIETWMAARQGGSGRSLLPMKVTSGSGRAFRAKQLVFVGKWDVRARGTILLPDGQAAVAGPSRGATDFGNLRFRALGLANTSASTLLAVVRQLGLIRITPDQTEHDSSPPPKGTSIIRRLGRDDVPDPVTPATRLLVSDMNTTTSLQQRFILHQLIAQVRAHPLRPRR